MTKKMMNNECEESCRDFKAEYDEYLKREAELEKFKHEQGLLEEIRLYNGYVNPEVKWISGLDVYLTHQRKNPKVIEVFKECTK